MEGFKVGGVYDFDNIYRCCPYNKEDRDCVCNNGYQCKREDNQEKCEHGISKCYSFSCPIVSDGASKEDIIKGLGDYDKDDIENLQFDDEDFTTDIEELVVLNEEI